MYKRQHLIYIAERIAHRDAQLELVARDDVFFHKRVAHCQQCDRRVVVFMAEMPQQHLSRFRIGSCQPAQAFAGRYIGKMPGVAEYALFQIIRAVSYTHLDVYKRQVHA